MVRVYKVLYELLYGIIVMYTIINDATLLINYLSSQKTWTCFEVRLAPSRRTALALRRMEATAVSASPEEMTTVIDALSAKTLT